MWFLNIPYMDMGNIHPQIPPVKKNIPKEKVLIWRTSLSPLNNLLLQTWNSVNSKKNNKTALLNLIAQWRFALQKSVRAAESLPAKMGPEDGYQNQLRKNIFSWEFKGTPPPPLK